MCYPTGLAALIWELAADDSQNTLVNTVAAALG
jgi:hypothetical protein